MYPWGVDYELALAEGYLAELAADEAAEDSVSEPLTDEEEMPPLYHLIPESCIANLLLLVGVGAMISFLVGLIFIT